ncbi:cytochrome b560 subunit of succinate dehydrogenase, partial [Patellaria atrata CBS 101060]
MLAQRAFQTTLRRVAAQPLSRAVVPAASFSQQRRLAATQNIPATATENELLVQQRLRRPVSPHISIYKAQITWYASGLNRITGVALAGSFYLYGLAYLVAPLTGWHIESMTLATAFAAWPAFAKVGVKFLAAWPFTYHAVNGLRHLSWDFAVGMKNKTVIQTGWVMVGTSFLGACYLAF